MSAAPEWCEPFVGIPFAEKGRDRAGVDCWGLARMVFAEQFGYSGLPTYVDEYADTKDRAGIAAAVRSGLLDGWEQTDQPSAGVLIILRLAGRPWHCAVMANKQWMLHALEGAGSVVERYDSMLWRNRVEGLYRYAGH